MSETARKRATYQDVLAAPAHRVAELVNGTLHTHSRPGARHSLVSSGLGMSLGPPFHHGDGGPGGWIILDEPELHFAQEVLVPDLAGWRRTRMPEVPEAPYFELAPDWVCEVLSPSTAAFDRAEKLPIYAGAEVQYAWLIDPKLRALEVLKLDAKTSPPKWQIAQTFEGDGSVQAEPFEAIELHLVRLWK